MINIPAIKIFACDYRKISDKWNLPFIRLGDNHSNAIINIGNDIENNKYMPAMSELDKIWWVAKHIEEFGKTDYVGFCHYRRFFSLAIDEPVVDINIEQLNTEYILTPEQELCLIIENNCVGCSMLPLCITPSDVINIWDQISYLDKSMPSDINKYLFDIYLEKCSIYLKDSLSKAYTQTSEYLCNIFTLRTDLFLELANMMFPTLVEFDNSLSNEYKKSIHPRYLGYYAERLISTYLHAIQINGKKILHLPLLTVDCWKHNKVIKDDTGKNIEVLDE